MCREGLGEGKFILSGHEWMNEWMNELYIACVR